MKTINKLFDLLPETVAGLKTFEAYAQNQIKKNHIDNNRLKMLLEECSKRIGDKEKEIRNGNT